MLRPVLLRGRMDIGCGPCKSTLMGSVVAARVPGWSGHSTQRKERCGGLSKNSLLAHGSDVGSFDPSVLILGSALF